MQNNSSPAREWLRFTLLEFYNGSEWANVKNLETLINQFEYDLVENLNLAVDRYSTAGLMKALANPKYTPLRKLATDCTTEGDELLGFGNSKYKIAKTKTGHNPWMLNDQRVVFEY